MSETMADLIEKMSPSPEKFDRNAYRRLVIALRHTGPVLHKKREYAYAVFMGEESFRCEDTDSPYPRDGVRPAYQVPVPMDVKVPLGPQGYSFDFGLPDGWIRSNGWLRGFVTLPNSDKDRAEIAGLNQEIKRLDEELATARSERDGAMNCNNIAVEQRNQARAERDAFMYRWDRASALKETYRAEFDLAVKRRDEAVSQLMGTEEERRKYHAAWGAAEKRIQELCAQRDEAVEMLHEVVVAVEKARFQVRGDADMIAYNAIAKASKWLHTPFTTKVPEDL